ncbi:hypothetical protein L7F22_061153 [Adiantum nelumboides]|nr:hypothetical protein [Adiantum nelumboides]
MAESNDVFCMLSSKDKLDGDNNYPLWTYSMQHVLISKGVWNIVQGIDVCPGSVDAESIEDAAARTTKQAWDILASLYACGNEAKIAYLRKDLELKIMLEDDDMNVFLAEIKDFKEQLISTEEVIPDHSLVQTILDTLPESYQNFASTWRLVTEDKPNVVKYDTLDVLEIDAWMQHFGGKGKAFGPGAVLAHYISTLLAGEAVIVHVEYSLNGRYNLFALQSLSKTLCLSTLAQSANMKDTANTIYIDSQSALAVARNPVFHARTKHIEVHYHYATERLSAREISLAYVPAHENLADLFTKALSCEKLEAFFKALGLLPFVD